MSKKILISFFSILFLSSCVETVVVSSVAFTSVATREKSLKQTQSDIAIYTTLTADLYKNGLNNFSNSVDASINEGRVLLTGIARDDRKAKLASKLAWNIKGVKEVIDEIQLIDQNQSMVKDFSKNFYDTYVTSKIETQMMFTKNIATFNYKITTVNQIVYLLGTAKNEDELERVINLVSKVRGVEKIISHVIMKHDSRRNG
jgi:osmotically-inducible protein OsmY